LIIADTSGLLAYFNSREPAHEAVMAIIEAAADPLVVSPFVLAELDYLVATRIGVEAEIALLDELASGAYDLAAFDAADLRTARDVVDRYRDQSIGVADASLVVLAERHSTRTVLTLDRRHFDVLRPLSGGRFQVVPSSPTARGRRR
jgi:predicted nucleic acid-binding protein